jgi:cytochrome c5
VSASDSGQDQSFFNTFMVVIGSLIAVTIFLIILGRYIGDQTQVQWVKNDPAYVAGVAERLTPPGKAGLPGDEPEAVAVVASADPAAPPAAKLTGEQVYNVACFACHGGGIGGAPKVGDAGQWGPRVAQGKATLNKHALEGFQGKAGFMPPKGGRVDLSDDEILDAVNYMVGKSG